MFKHITGIGMVFFWFPISLSGQTLSFAPPVDIGSGSVQGISALDIADLNLDGRPDIVVMEGGAHAGGRATLCWFEQRPDNGWLRHELGNTEDLDDFIGSARCADIDDDGDLDIVGEDAYAHESRPWYYRSLKY